MTHRSRTKQINSVRDIVIIRFDRNVLVVSCDSSGAIGPKRMDVIRVNPAIVGQFVSRVALMEVIAVGARPICLSMALCVEPRPVGQLIMKGAIMELKRSGLGGIRVVQSSEKNFKVKQTGVGASVIGVARSDDLKIGKCERGDLILAVGYPCVGNEVISGMRSNVIADTRDLLTLTKAHFIREILPVGSKGILREAEIMATDSQLHFRPVKNSKIDMRKSAGPATVILCDVAAIHAAQIKEVVIKPVTIIGELN